MLRIGSQEAKPCELINGGVLEQAQLRVRNTPAGHYFHIYLYPLTGIGHLLVGLGFIGRLLLRLRKQAQLPHDPEQALRPAGIAPLPQAVPQFHHAQVWASLPKVDVRSALVVLPVGAADAIFLCVFHQGLPVCHVLCYTLTHEGYGPLSSSCCVVTQL